jgi:dimethylhistidine N-methyltransferase
MEALQRHTQSAINADSDNQFSIDVIEGLRKQQKQLPSKYFYDSKGSQLFDRICDLPEYYPYRTELSMLPKISQDMDAILQEKHHIVEFGAGSLVKIRLLLEEMAQVESYVPIDIAGEHLNKSSQLLKKEFRHLNVHPVIADFTQQVRLPDMSDASCLGFFPGSTIGNFTPDDAIQFLISARKTLGNNPLLLIGVDTKKHPAILHDAYNDKQGVTAAFNQNILVRINREACANFNVDQFQHYAYYNMAASRIEMHLVSQQDQQIQIGTDRIFISEGESIHTENSHKYTPREFSQLASHAGWDTLNTWTDDNHMFSVHLLGIQQ